MQRLGGRVGEKKVSQAAAPVELEEPIAVVNRPGVLAHARRDGFSPVRCRARGPSQLLAQPTSLAHECALSPFA